MKKYIVVFFFLLWYSHVLQAQSPVPQCRVLEARWFQGNKLDILTTIFNQPWDDTTIVMRFSSQSTEGDLAFLGCNNNYFLTFNADFTEQLGGYCRNPSPEMGFSRFYVVDGDTVSFGYMYHPGKLADVAIRRHRADGSLVYLKSYGGENMENAQHVTQTPDGRYFYVTTGSLSNTGDLWSSYPGTNFDAWVLKLDALTGDTLWTRCYGGTGDDAFTDIYALADGGCMMIGAFSSSDGDVSNAKGSDDIWVVRIDSMGTILWDKSLGGSSAEGLRAGIGENRVIVPDGAGGYYIAASTMSMDGDIVQRLPHYKDWWILHIDSAANILWEHTYGTPKFDLRPPASMCIAADGSLWIVGEIEEDTVTNAYKEESYGRYDGWVLHLDSEGNFINQLVIGTYREDEFTTVYPLADNTVLVGGHFNTTSLSRRKSAHLPDTNRYGMENNRDAILLRLSPESLDVPSLQQASFDWSLYPNPVSNQELQLEVRGYTGSPLQYELLDMQGRSHRRGIVDPSGSSRIGVSGLAAGTYQVRLYNNSQQDVKAVVINH